MNISAFALELRLISKHSQLIRSKLTSYGFSSLEINAFLVYLARCGAPDQTNQTSMPSHCKQQIDSVIREPKQYKKFEQSILAVIQEQKSSLSEYLGGFLGRLEYCLA